jgi:hypothetical protein
MDKKRGQKRARVDEADPQLHSHLPATDWITACGKVIGLVNDALRVGGASRFYVVPQGSYVQSLQLDGSDLDLVLLDGSDRWRNMSKNSVKTQLDMACDALRRAKWMGIPLHVDVLQRIYQARIPILKLRARTPTGHMVQIDLCFGDDSRGACDQRIRHLVSESEDCRRFVLGMKIWAKSRGLTNTHTGGLSCFAVVIVALFHWKCRRGNPKFFLEFFLFLRSLTEQVSVSLDEMKIVTRPTAESRQAVIFVAVPTRPTENAARTLFLNVWNRKIIPELDRAIALSSGYTREMTIDVVVSDLISHRDPPSLSADLVELESSSDEEPGEPLYKRHRPEVIDCCDSETSSMSSVSEDRFIRTFVPRPIPRPITPIKVTTIIECPDCEYSTFAAKLMRNHKYAVHSFPASRPAPPSPKRGQSIHHVPRNIQKSYREAVGYEAPRPYKKIRRK